MKKTKTRKGNNSQNIFKKFEDWIDSIIAMSSKTLAIIKNHEDTFRESDMMNIAKKNDLPEMMNIMTNISNMLETLCRRKKINDDYLFWYGISKIFVSKNFPTLLSSKSRTQKKKEVIEKSIEGFFRIFLLYAMLDITMKLLVSENSDKYQKQIKMPYHDFIHLSSSILNKMNEMFAKLESFASLRKVLEKIHIS